ncbi:hypothetical protein F66182_1212 [Fusarium sp. NRRL 66182]|nr:hypothetical protein F66182_1212 [Fusarium sp. NRRL 66182]
MASPSPAPSRAAVNALRGVLLTTSCSVIILAEERRRRLNIARAALENAKKLHTARVNHNSAALAESYSGRREAFPIEIAHDFSPSPAANNPLRRRRRRIDQLENDLSHTRENESVNTIETASTESIDSAGTSQARQRKWDEWDAARKELSRLSETTSFAHNSLFLRIPVDNNLPIPSLPKQRLRTKTPGTRGTDRNSPEVTAQRAGSTKNISAVASGNPISAQDPKANGPLRLAFLGRDADRPLENPGNDTLTEHSASLPALDAVLQELESMASFGSGYTEEQKKAAAILRELISQKVEGPQMILSRGIRLLQSTAISQQYSILPIILDAVQPICQDICLLAVPFLDRVLENRDTEGVRHLLKGSSRFEPCATEQASRRNKNEWVTRLLMHYWRKTKDFAEVKSIYGILQESGLFTDGIFPKNTQYAIRRRIALIALDAGDDATARAEMSQLCSMSHKVSDLDVKLRGRFIVRDAELNHWEKVWSKLDTFSPKEQQSAQFQNVLSWLTKIYCKDHSPAEIDIFARDLIKTHNMTLNKPLAFLVMDRHGRSRDLQALVAWLQFCQEGGLEMDQIFFNEIADKCCIYWSLSRADVVRMLKGVQSSMPWLHDPLLASYSKDGGLHDLHKPLPGQSKDRYGIMSALPESRGDSMSIFERAAFKHMNTLALGNEWSRVYSAYQEAVEKGIGASARCLRLAVVANIHMEGPHSPTASSLVDEAHAGGCDISSALVPMLIARLEAGDNVGDLLQGALDKGQHIHDSVYNKAARVLTQKGNPEAAIRVCEVAAQQNGTGELAYNKYNFASLVHCYAGQGHYRDLQSLIASFNSKSEWWQGSKECKESLKLAMKHVAEKAARECRGGDVHREALLYLDDALLHVKSLRATNCHEREALIKEIVGVFETVEQPPSFEGGFFPNAQAERQGHKEKRHMDRDIFTKREPPPHVTEGTRHRIVEDDIPARNQKIEAHSTGQETTSSPESNKKEEVFLKRQSLAAAFF